MQKGAPIGWKRDFKLSFSTTVSMYTSLSSQNEIGVYARWQPAT
jgi:hypothetical protein